MPAIAPQAAADPAPGASVEALFVACAGQAGIGRIGGRARALREATRAAAEVVARAEIEAEEKLRRLEPTLARLVARTVREVVGALEPEEAAYLTALNALLDKGAGAAVITLGGAGSVTLGDGGELLRMPALSSTVVDTTAAGDTFIGALAAARLEGLPLFECMAAGARASAVTVSRLGAQQSIPTRAEVEHWFG